MLYSCLALLITIGEGVFLWSKRFIFWGAAITATLAFFAFWPALFMGSGGLSWFLVIYMWLVIWLLPEGWEDV